jgi:uncharacterized protein (DUF983 family)
LPEPISLPEFDTTVCVVPSMFVHVTTPPTATCTVCGLNAKFCIATLADDGRPEVDVVVALCVVVVVGAAVVEVVEGAPVVVVVVVPEGCCTQPLTNTAADSTISVAKATASFPIIN